MKKIISALLVCVLMVTSLCSCEGKFSPFDTSWIIEVDGERVSSEIYNYYAYCAYEMYSYYGYINANDQLKKQSITVYDEQTDTESKVRADKQINEYALGQTLYLYTLMSEYEAAGLTMDEDTLSTLEENAEYEYQSYQALFEANGISEDTILLASTSGKFAQMEEDLFIAEYGENGKNPVSEDELYNYYKENYVSYAYVSQKFVDDGGIPLDDSEKDVMRAELADVKKSVENGADMTELAVEYINALAEDSKCGKGGKNLSTVEKGDSDLMQVLDEMKPGEVKYVEIKNCGYVIKKYDLDSNEYFEDEDNKLSILRNIKYEQWSEQFSEKVEQISYTLNGSAYRKYGINRLKEGEAVETEEDE